MHQTMDEEHDDYSDESEPCLMVHKATINKNIGLSRMHLPLTF